jgi:hypothetical protein
MGVGTATATRFSGDVRGVDEVCLDDYEFVIDIQKRVVKVREV